MHVCQITMTTTIDGQENCVTHQGELQKGEDEIFLSYRDGQALVGLTFGKDRALLKREGDYSLYLPLERCVFLEGAIGISGSEGQVRTYAHKIDYSLSQTGLLSILHYEIWFGEEVQKVQLRLHVKFI